MLSLRSLNCSTAGEVDLCFGKVTGFGHSARGRGRSELPLQGREQLELARIINRRVQDTADSLLLLRGQTIEGVRLRALPRPLFAQLQR